jgi:hypothetical protein
MHILHPFTATPLKYADATAVMPIQIVVIAFSGALMRKLPRSDPCVMRI